MRFFGMAVVLSVVIFQAGGTCLLAGPMGTGKNASKAEPSALPEAADSKQILALLQKAARQKPKNADAQAKRREAIVAAVDKILDGKPDAAELRNLIDAVAKCVRAGTAHPEDVPLAVKLGEYAEQSGEIKLAIETYQGFGLVFKTQPEMSDAATRLLDAAQRLRMFNTPLQLEGRLLNGASLNWAGYRGKVVLIDFWATFCKPCIAEIPNIKENFAKYHDRGFDVVGISVDKSREALVAFLAKAPVPWAVCRDGDSPASMAQHYGVSGIPKLFLIGRDGKLAAMNCRGAALGPAIEKALDAKPAQGDRDGESKHDFAEKPKKPREPTTSPGAAQLREWSDVSGTFHAKAKFRGLIGKLVKLELEDGRTISVPLEKFSDADRDYIRGRGR